jgi:hypothetical protein
MATIIPIAIAIAVSLTTSFKNPTEHIVKVLLHSDKSELQITDPSCLGMTSKRLCGFPSAQIIGRFEYNNDSFFSVLKTNYL